VSGSQGKKRVAIIGGGPSALAAAFELTDPERANQYEVTIYQQGWRLGGKCASGRNPDTGFGKRVEEHGLHIWFGCYENARRMVERCYDELGKAAPYRSFEEAFEGIDHIVLGQHRDGEWSFPELHFPRNRLAPLHFAGFVSEALTWAARRLQEILPPKPVPEARWSEPWWQRARSILEALDLDEPNEGQEVDRLLHGASSLERGITGIFRDVRAAGQAQHDPTSLIDKFAQLSEAVLPDRDSEPAEVRFYRETVRLLYTVLRGVWRDGVLDEGFDKLNDVDLAAWLKKHDDDFPDNPLDWPALVRAVYDGCFAFEGGDVERPRMAAGRALQGAIRCLLHYRGSVLYRPRGSMSDAVIAPVAQLLHHRGVEFCFYHAAKELRPSTDGMQIQEIDVVQQLPVESTKAAIRARPGRPLTWSTRPPDSVLAGAQLGGRSPVLLEQEIDPFHGKVITLDADGEQGGFDWVILAVPPDVQREICGPLAKADSAYARMLDESRSVMTQASQLWVRRSAEELGQRFTSASLVSCYVEPLDTYADMAHLRRRERWSKEDDVRHIAYFCGVLPEAGIKDQREADEAARAQLAAFLEHDIGQLWPDSVRADGKGFEWDLLAPATGQSGAAALDRQYYRANWSNTERYVLTLPGSVKHRLSPDWARFGNLVLAGDWTANGLDSGCLEAAVTSGRLAARRICGNPPLDDIPGVNGPPGFPNSVT
jgi:uncharacterized protein with NAD-binding domain and iron-sulfur cluster